MPLSNSPKTDISPGSAHIKRFWKKVSKQSACWIWTGYKTTRGYGRIRVNGALVIASRFSYHIHYGKIEEGKLVCHTCDNPSCVNPDHLFLGTNEDNVSDMMAKERQRKGENKSAAKLTDAQVREIRAAYIPWKVTQKKLAQKHGVSPAIISFVVNRRTWKHV